LSIADGKSQERNLRQVMGLITGNGFLSPRRK
jgi:hypothetical protein